MTPVELATNIMFPPWVQSYQWSEYIRMMENWNRLVNPTTSMFPNMCPAITALAKQLNNPAMMALAEQVANPPRPARIPLAPPPQRTLTEKGIEIVAAELGVTVDAVQKAVGKACEQTST